MSLCVALIIKCGKHVSREPHVSAGHLDNRVMSCTTLDYIVFTTSAHHHGLLTNNFFFRDTRSKLMWLSLISHLFLRKADPLVNILGLFMSALDHGHVGLVELIDRLLLML